MKLQGKVGVVTGGAGGIGRAISLRLASEGAHTMVVDLKSEEAREVAEEIRSAGGMATSFKVDVTKSGAVNEMVDAVLDSFGKIDILVNNAGGSAREKATLFCKSTEDVWDLVIERNLKSVLICSRAVIMSMMERKTGKIVNVASCSGLVGTPGAVDYSAAKAGVIGFTRALAHEVASYGIHVNCVAPGPTDTTALERLDRNRLARQTGLGRLGRPDEIAATVSFLATDDASFITGQIVPVCGLRNLGWCDEGRAGPL